MEYGEYKIDNTQVPTTVIDRLLNRAFAHIMSNECKSHVISKSMAHVKREGEKASDKAVKDRAAAWREDEANTATMRKWEDDFRTAKMAAILDGTLSVVVARAPTRDPVEAAARQIARLELVAGFKRIGLKFPTGDNTLPIDQPDGSVVEMTADELIDARLARPEDGARIQKAAAAKVAADAKLREAVVKASGAEGGVAGLI